MRIETIEIKNYRLFRNARLTDLSPLIEEFRDYARRGGQVFVSTHSPDFLNGAELNEIYWLEKSNGFSTIKHASDSELLRNLVEEGDLPGALWKQGLFEGAAWR